jgi:hypothetical protein
MDKETKDTLIKGAAAGGTLWAGKSLADDYAGESAQAEAGLAEALDDEDVANAIGWIATIALTLSWIIGAFAKFGEESGVETGWVINTIAFLVVFAIVAKFVRPFIWVILSFIGLGLLFTTVFAFFNLFGGWAEWSEIGEVYHWLFCLLCPYFMPEVTPAAEEALSAMWISSGITIT